MIKKPAHVSDVLQTLGLPPEDRSDRTRTQNTPQVVISAAIVTYGSQTWHRGVRGCAVNRDMSPAPGHSRQTTTQAVRRAVGSRRAERPRGTTPGPGRRSLVKKLIRSI